MKIILDIYKKLKSFFYKRNNASNQINDENIAGAITFTLYKDANVDILCLLPESSKMNADQITEESENFGKFISSITDGLVADTIVQLLDKTKANTDNPNEKLFIENVLFFWAMNHVTYNKKISASNLKGKKGPVIKPTEVFAQTKSMFD